MSGVYVPSFAEALEVGRNRGRNSEAPHLWDGLQLHYSFLQGGGKVLYDTSGYDNYGIPTNFANLGTAWKPTNQRRLPWALALDGTNDYLSSAILLPSDSYTITIQIKVEESKTQYLFDARTGGGTGYCYINGLTLVSSPSLKWIDGVQANLLTLNKWQTITLQITTLSAPSAMIWGKFYNSAANFLHAQIAGITIHKGSSSNIHTQLYHDPLAMVTRRAIILPAAVAAPAGAGGSPLHMESPLLGSVA